MRYLRPPLKKGTMMRSNWDPVTKKVERRLEGWQAKLLSRASQLVLAAIPIFQLSLYKLPIGVGKRTEGLMRRFLWKGSESD